MPPDLMKRRKNKNNDTIRQRAVSFIMSNIINETRSNCYSLFYIPNGTGR